MLVLTRKVGESINIGPDIVIKVCRINGDRVAIGITAPDEIAVRRGEFEAKRQQSEGAE